MSSNILSGDELIVSKNATVGQVLTCTSASGKASWQAGGGGGGFNTQFRINPGTDEIDLVDGGGTFSIATAGIVTSGGGFNTSLSVAGPNLQLVDGNGTLNVPAADIVSAGGYVPTKIYISTASGTLNLANNYFAIVSGSGGSYTLPDGTTAGQKIVLSVYDGNGNTFTFSGKIYDVEGDAVGSLEISSTDYMWVELSWSVTDDTWYILSYRGTNIFVDSGGG